MAPAHSSHDSGAAARLPAGLGWFSLGLGTAQLAAPGAVNRLIGVHDDARSRRLQRLVGVQELTAAAGIFSDQTRPARWLWGRTAGDVLHVAMVSRALGGRADSRPRMIGTIGALAGCFAADLYASVRTSGSR